MNKESFKRQLRILRRKKWPVAVTVILVIALIAAPIAVNRYSRYKRFSVKNPLPYSQIFILKSERKQVQLIAHRGYNAQAPENTLPAFQKASEYGFDTVEFDVHQTADGVWVVAHDENIKSVTDKNGKISSMTYYDLVTASIDVGANHREYENLRIPTLEQVLKICLENNLKPMIEIKTYKEEGIKTLLETVEKYGYTQSCSIISFDCHALELVKKENPDIQLYYLTNDLSDGYSEKILKSKSMGISFNGNKKGNSEGKVKTLVEAGVPLACWTVDDGETMQKYFKMGVTTFVTNKIYPR